MPTSKTRHAIVSRIEALLALKRSPNEEEAARAAEKARELMARYGISETTVMVKEDDREQGAVMETIADLGGAKEIPWRRMLLNNLSSATSVRFTSVVDGHHAAPTGKRKRGQYVVTHREYRLLGLPHLVATCQTLYEYLSATIERLALEAVEAGRADYEQRKAARTLPKNYYRFSEHGWSGWHITQWLAGVDFPELDQPKVRPFNPEAYATSFREECARRVGFRVYEKYRALESEGLPASEQGPAVEAIVLANQFALARQRADELHAVHFDPQDGVNTGARSRRRYDVMGARAGDKAGGEISLDPQLADTASTRLLA